MKHIDRCFQISHNIINSYNILKEIGVNFGTDSIQFKSMVEKIKTLVIKEYNMYSYLDIPTASRKLDEFADMEEFDSYSYRMSSQLESLLELSCDQGFDYDDYVSDNKNFINFKFVLSDIICTILEIEILKNMDKNVCDIIASDNYSEKYKKEFKKNHIEYLIYYFTIRGSSEAIALNYAFDINECPKLSFDTLIHNLCYKYGVEIDSTNNEFKNGFVRMALMTLKNLINLLAESDSVDKDYQYLFYLTAFSVYVNNLNYDGVELLTSCLNSIYISDENTKNKLRKILIQKEGKN